MVDRTSFALEGFAAQAEGRRCPYWGGLTFAAWQLGRIRAELGEQPPARVYALDGAHLLVDGQIFQFQELEGAIAFVPVTNPTEPTAHHARENAKCPRFKRI